MKPPPQKLNVYRRRTRLAGDAARYRQLGCESHAPSISTQLLLAPLALSIVAVACLAGRLYSSVSM